jgi:hypothetical protein
LSLRSRRLQVIKRGGERGGRVRGEKKTSQLASPGPATDNRWR